MKYLIKGGSEVDLNQNNFIASGGFGKVYKNQNLAYKIYDDSKNMLPVAKINELSVLKDQDIIKPEQIVLNKSKEVVGYTMRYVKGFPIAKMFTHTFKNNNQITNKMCLNLLNKFYSKIEYVHNNDILLVDVNELNFLINDSFNEIYFIDTDGYQTKSFLAQGIMDNIRDRHCNNKFTKETDWYSWGILACQLLTGLHPFRGGHPDFENVNPASRLDLRMQKNVSIFNSKTKLPPFVQNFDNIPSGLKQWFASVFESCNRSKPPKDFESIIAINNQIVNKIKGTNLFDINLIENYKDLIIKYKNLNGDKFVLFKNFILFNGKKYNIPNKTQFYFNNPVALNKPFVYYLDNNQIKCFDCIAQNEIESNLYASDIFQVENRIYYLNKDKFYELDLIKISNKILCESKVTGNVLDIPNATKTFEGTLMQNMLGRHYFSIIPKSGHSYQFGIKELDKYTILDCKYERNVLIICAIDRKGSKDKFVIKFNSNYTSYSVRKIEDLSNSEINFAVNNTGICVFIKEDGKLEIFSNFHDSQSIKELTDPEIDTTMCLTHDENKIVFTQNNDLYSISLKK